MRTSLVVSMIVFCLSVALLYSASVPVAGEAAPEFTLPTQEGNTVHLKDYRGKWVVLYFYPKDFTSGCTLEARNFQRDQAEYQKKNAVVLGVSLDTVDSHKSFCTKEGLSFKLLSDEKGKVSQQYGSLAGGAQAQYSARNTFLIDPQGRIAKVYTSVNPAGHSAEVLAALDGLQTSSAGK